MNNMELPVILKKKNGMMIGAAILEIIVAGIFGITLGFKSICFWIFLFTACITAISVWGEKGEIIILKENKIEFYKNQDLLKSIKYNNIDTLSLEKGMERKNSSKDFIVINYTNYSGKKNKNKEIKLEKYFINPLNYSLNDLKVIENVISSKNENTKLEERLKSYIK